MTSPHTKPAPSAEYARIVDDLTYRYDGDFNRETVQRAVDQARTTLAPVAKFPNFLPILTERFARDQLLTAAQAEGKVVTGVPEILFVCVHNAGRSPPVSSTRAGWFREQLDRPEQFAGFVIEHPDEGVVSAALGSCGVRAPSPHNVSGAHGRVFNISAEPVHRRCGYGRACLTALLTWFDADTGVRVIDLNVTPDGAGMYQSAGFGEPAFPSLRLLLRRPAER